MCLFTSLTVCQQQTHINNMTQYTTVLSILVVLAVFKPIVCPASRMFGERRDRAPYIESSEYSPQHLGGDANEGRLRKATTQNKEQPVTPAKASDQETKDSAVEKKIRNVFSTNLGPGLHLFNNTAPFVNEPHFKSYNDVMIGDQPLSYAPPFLSPPSDREFFKVQRSPDGTLSLVYNETYATKDEKINAHDKRLRDSNKTNPNNRSQTHISNGLPLKTQTSSPTLTVAKPGNEKFHVNDCLEEDEIKKNKTYCSNLRNYPRKDHLEELIQKKFSNLEALFGEDLIVPESFDQRMANDPNEEFFCRSRQVVIYPQSGQNKDYEWFYIVNSDKFKQGIRIQECLDPYTPCGEHVGLTLPSHYETSCEQHYIYRTLVAYDGEKDALFKETFRLPACCGCVLRNKLKPV